MPCATREEQREYQRKWIARRRSAWLSANGPCVKCGSTEHLEVDHIDPETKVNHNVWSWKEERRLGELAKCQILCYDCHKNKTREQFTYPLIHGTALAYGKKGCRCRVCKDGHAEARRVYRAKLKAEFMIDAAE